MKNSKSWNSKRLDSVIHRNLEYFLKASVYGSLNEASKHIGVSQSALSVALTNLESSIGIRLFERTKAGVKLTSQGTELAKRFFGHLREFEQDIVSVSGNSFARPIKIGAIEHFGANHLIPVFRKKTNFPPFQLFLHRSLTVSEAVRQGKLDFGFVSWSKKPKDIGSIRVKNDPVAIVGLKSKFPEIARAKTMGDLLKYSWVHTPMPQFDFTEFLGNASSGCVAGGFFSQKSAILAGVGIGEVQLDAYLPAEQKLLVRSPAKSLHPDAAIYAVFKKDISSVTRKVLEDLLSAFEFKSSET